MSKTVNAFFAGLAIFGAAEGLIAASERIGLQPTWANTAEAKWSSLHGKNVTIRDIYGSSRSMLDYGRVQIVGASEHCAQSANQAVLAGGNFYIYVDEGAYTLEISTGESPTIPERTIKISAKSIQSCGVSK